MPWLGPKPTGNWLEDEDKCSLKSEADAGDKFANSPFYYRRKSMLYSLIPMNAPQILS
jgi:hypothetical protein